MFWLLRASNWVIGRSRVEVECWSLESPSFLSLECRMSHISAIMDCFELVCVCALVKRGKWCEKWEGEVGLEFEGLGADLG